jgi:hypothetical protein
MNIQQYYRSVANASLNGSLAALIPIFMFIFPLSIYLPKKEMVFLTIPFLLYSFISYQFYLLNQERSLNAKLGVNKESDKFQIRNNEHLLTFLPAASLRMQLFSTDGLAYGEVRDLNNSRLRWFLPYFIDRLFPAEYGLYNQENQLVVAFKWTARKAIVISERGERILEIEESQKGLFSIRSHHGPQILRVYSKSLYTDIQFMNEQDMVVARLRKGWMRLEWEKYFKDANTPVLSFDESLSEVERLSVLALLTKIYRYRNH